jgi:hypothetical protein
MGLINGSIGTIYDVEWDYRQDPSLMPLALLVKFDEYTRPVFAQYRLGIVLVFPAICQFDFKGVICSYT